MRNDNPRFAVKIEPIKHDRGGQSVIWNLEIVYLDQKDSKPRNCSRTDFDSPGAIFDDLAILAYISWHNGKWSEPSHGYYEYRSVYTVDHQTIGIFDRGLKKCAKVQNNFPVQSATFAQYVIMLCKGLGVEWCVRRTGPDRSMYTEAEWQVRKIDSVASMIEHEFDSLRKAVCPQEEAA